ncbi:MAG: apolipoprotein N-acyltransferase, partial [Nitrospinae bacterium RIFCSPLOWO2_12_FULL_47_7]
MPNLKNLKPLILSIFSGLLLVLIFPRFNLELLAWVALIPLFFAIENQTLPLAALYGFLTGAVFYFCGLSWITITLVNYGRQPEGLSWVCLGFLVFYLSAYIALFCYLAKRLSGGNPFYFFILAPFVWISLEYIRSTHSEYGFSWLGLGYSQFLNLPLIQFASITGVYGISMLIVAVNAAIYLLINTCVFHRGKTNWPQTILAAGIAIVAVGICFLYGEQALRSSALANRAPTVKVALIQGNIDQNQKWNPLYSERINNIYRDLSLKAAESKPDLIVWPEAATPFLFNLNKPETESLKNLIRSVHIPFVFGSPYQESGATGTTIYNRAYFINAAGETVGSYDKIHLVPFGEFVPFRKMLWFVNKLVEMVGDFGRGESAPLFGLKNNHFSISICYEITFPDQVRLPVKEGAEFLVNITNDAWYGNSAAPYQHISMAALRAVENRVPIIRAANTGVSGTIDAS